MKGKISHQCLRVLCVCLAGALCALLWGWKITPGFLLKHLSKNRTAAALLLLGLYAVKSLSFFFPLAVLQTACGAVFPFLPAIVLNLCGTGLAMALPWLLSRRGSGLAEIRRRFPILQKAQALRPPGDFLYVLFLRAAGCFPFDAVSLYLGALKIPPAPYFAAGLLGCLPQLLLATALGAGLAKPSADLLTIGGIAAASCAAVLTLCRIAKARTR